jgi:hypothetical protein
MVSVADLKAAPAACTLRLGAISPSAEMRCPATVRPPVPPSLGAIERALVGMLVATLRAYPAPLVAAAVATTLATSPTPP